MGDIAELYDYDLPESFESHLSDYFYTEREKAKWVAGRVDEQFRAFDKMKRRGQTMPKAPKRRREPGGFSVRDDLPF